MREQIRQCWRMLNHLMHVFLWSSVLVCLLFCQLWLFWLSPEAEKEVEQMEIALNEIVLMGAMGALCASFLIGGIIRAIT